MKRKITIFILLFVAILLLLIPLSSIVKADKWAMQYGYLCPGYSQTERTVETEVCQNIYNDFLYDQWLHGGSIEPFNDYWDLTNTTWVGMCLDYQRANSEYVTNWWVGDFHWSGSPPTPLGHVMNYGFNGDDISDSFIYAHASNYGQSYDPQKFNFIWTCSSAGLYWSSDSGTYYNVPGIFPDAIHSTPTPTSIPVNYNTWYGWHYYGNAIGMPLAWTGTNSMSRSGYYSTSGDYTYIGFEANSPFMINVLPGTSTVVYNFPLGFYNKVLGFYDNGAHQSIHDSLQYISTVTYGQDFDDTALYNGYWVHRDFNGDSLWFYCRMRVFGNGAATIPY